MNLKDKLLITFGALLSAVLVLLICGFSITLMNPGVAHAQAPSLSDLPRPRFEHVLTEYKDIDAIYRTIVIHDRETGQEILCIDGRDKGAFSCLLTGRVWGGVKQPEERPKHVGIPAKRALP